MYKGLKDVLCFVMPSRNCFRRAWWNGNGWRNINNSNIDNLLKYEQLRAQGVNLVAFIPMALVALFIHIKNKLVDFKNTWLLAVVGCGFSLIGALIANSISNSILKKLFAVFLIGLGIWQFIELKKGEKKNKN